MPAPQPVAPSLEELELRSGFESRTAMLIRTAPLTQATRDQLEELRSSLPTGTTVGWATKLRVDIRDHLGVIDAKLASEAFARKLDLVRETNNADDVFAELLKSRKSARSNQRSGLPADWNELVVRYSQPWPKMDDFEKIDITKIVPTRGTNSGHLHQLLDDSDIVSAAYIIADYNSRDDYGREERYAKPIGAQLGVLLFQLESMVRDFRRSPDRFNLRRQRATPPS